MLLESAFESHGSYVAWQLNALLFRQLPAVFLRVIAVWHHKRIPGEHFPQDLRCTAMLLVLFQPLQSALCSTVAFPEQVLDFNALLCSTGGSWMRALRALLCSTGGCSGT